MQGPPRGQGTSMWVAVYTAAEPSPLFFKQVRARARAPAAPINSGSVRDSVGASMLLVVGRMLHVVPFSGCRCAL